MLKIAKEARFARKVTAHAPDGVTTREETFTVHYRGVPTDEYNKFKWNTPEGTLEGAQRIVVSIDEVVDAAGSPVAYSADMLAEIQRHAPWALGAIVETYERAVAGARLGN